MAYKKLEIEGFIGFRLQQTAWNARGQFQKIISHMGIKITLEQAQVLLSLYKSEGISQIQLASQVFKGRTNITRIINGLITHNLIVRHRDSIDKRCFRIYLTDEGKEIVNRIAPILVDYNQELIKRIGKNKHHELMEAIDEVNEMISSLYSSYLNIVEKEKS